MPTNPASPARPASADGLRREDGSAALRSETAAAAPPGPAGVWDLAAIELVLTTVMVFIAVSATRLLIGSLTPELHGWWNTTSGRLFLVGPVVGYTIAVMMMSPWGRRSGAHVNPAITVAMWRYGRTPGAAVVPIIAAQLIGSLLGPLAARCAWGPSIARSPLNYAAVQPGAHWNQLAVAGVEAATMMVIVSVAGIGIGTPRLRKWTPLAIGTLIGLQIALFGTTSGGVANPARQFGPALLSGTTTDLAVYLVAPVIGAVAGTVAVTMAARVRNQH